MVIPLRVYGLFVWSLSDKKLINMKYNWCKYYWFILFSNVFWCFYTLILSTFLLWKELNEMLHYRWWARNYETSDSLVNIFPDWMKVLAKNILLIGFKVRLVKTIKIAIWWIMSKFGWTFRKRLSKYCGQD